MTEKDKDFLEGLAISAACHVLPARKVFREPIAYSYNGVILPKLPEWDSETYPYAMISSNVSPMLHLCKYKPTAYTVDGHVRIKSIGEYQQGDVQSCNVIDGKWEIAYPMQTGKVVFSEDLVWCNTTIYYEDGKLYKETTDRIPVYE